MSLLSKDCEKYFLYPSRIVPEKRIEFAINAFRIFSKENPGWKLVVVGSVSETKEHQTYLQQLRALAEGNAIEFKINVPDTELRDLYSQCIGILYSPINEDFGLIPLESFASSKPCISVNEGGPKETIDDGTDGFLVNSPEEMADRMNRFAKQPELAEEMGKKGRKKVEAKFTWKHFLTRF